MPRTSPPKHRHDGTSPLPLGMDWSPPPKRWDGRKTTWPHNPHTGWSYCVMIPSWLIRTGSGASSESFLNPIVLYRIHVGIQSPEGLSTSQGILRRFSDFLKLFSALKKTFPKKDIPAAPPKHALLRIHSSRLLLEERRHALEEWMGKVLSDIDLSRSAPVAAFLELEAAARSAFQDLNQHSVEKSSLVDAFTAAFSLPVRPSPGASDGSTVASLSHSVTSDAGSENAYETSDLGTPREGKDHLSGMGREFLASGDEHTPVGAVNNGVILGELIIDQPEESLRNTLGHRNHNLFLGRDYGSSSKEFLSRDRIECSQDHDKLSNHARKSSNESIGSDISSIRYSELSLPGMTNSICDGSSELPADAETTNAVEEMKFLNDAQIVLPRDQRHKLNRVLLTMQRRLVTAKTDMEDLISRLDQEMAVKEYLTTKVMDIEVELEATKQKSKENLQQAILIERERVTQMQWDMDELRRKYTEMESKIKLEQSEKIRVESEKVAATGDKELLLKELDTKREQLENLQNHLENLEMKSKADIKVLVKEVKSLRSSQSELKEMLNQSLKEKTRLERTLQNEKQQWTHAKLARKKLLHECGVLRNRLQECSVDVLSEDVDNFVVNPSISDALDLLTTSDNRIGLLLAEAQLLEQDDEHAVGGGDKIRNSESSENLITNNGDDLNVSDDELRKMLADAFTDNARLRKQVNSVIRCALKNVVQPEKDDCKEVTSRKNVLNRFLER